MKKAGFCYLFFIFFPFIVYSQGNDSLKKFEKRIFISAGVNTTQYYSDAFFKNLFNKTGSADPVQTTGNTVINGSTVPSKFNYNKSSACPIISMGLELNSSRHKRPHHIVEVSYMKISGDYSYSVSYNEGPDGSPPSWSHINDTVQSKFTQTILSFGYKLQPTYKFIFFSFGINCSVNLIKIDQQKKEQIDHWFFDEASSQTIHSYTINNTSNTTSNLHFITVPLQFGAGGYVKIKRMVLKPAFYFTPNFKKGYNFYTVSLGALYKF